MADIDIKEICARCEAATRRLQKELEERRKWGPSWCDRCALYYVNKCPECERDELRGAVEKLERQVACQREAIKATPTAALKLIGDALAEPLECGHPLKCLDEDAGECLWCKSNGAVERLADALVAANYSSTCWCPDWDTLGCQQLEVCALARAALRSVGR